MLGYEVEKLLQEENLKYWASDREVDITDYQRLEEFGKNKNVEWVINCSGYTQVDKAEEEIGEAFRINQQGVRNIALFCQKRRERQTKLIHISTDYVFDGQKEKEMDDSYKGDKRYEENKGYKEEDQPNPLNIYGKSKLAGEEEIKNLLNTYFIIRTAWLYGKNGSNFVYTMLRLFKEKEMVRVVDDQWGSPTYAKDLARVLIKIVKSENKSEGEGESEGERGNGAKPCRYGIYHFTNEGVTSWYEFARTIYREAKRLGLIKENKKVEIQPIKTEEYPTPARRPRYSVLSKEKIKKELNIKIPYWKESLEKCLKGILDEGYRI